MDFIKTQLCNTVVDFIVGSKFVKVLFFEDEKTGLLLSSELIEWVKFK